MDSHSFVDMPMTHQNVLWLKVCQGNRLVDHSFQRHYFSAAQAGIRRNHQLGFGVHNPGRQTGRSEAGENHGVHES